MTRRIAAPRGKAPIPKPNYGTSIGHGMEARVYAVPGKPGLVHKLFSLSWISRKYPMGGKLEWITRMTYSPTLAIKDVQPPKYGRHGLLRITPSQWSKITFILTGHSADVIKTARKLGIPTPKVYRPVSVQGKEGQYYVLEISDLRKPGTVLIPGNEIYAHNRKNPITNFDEITEAMFADKKKLNTAGFTEDIGVHEQLGGFVVRINEKTGRAERFLVDTSNMFYSKKLPRAGKKTKGN